MEVVVFFAVEVVGFLVVVVFFRVEVVVFLVVEMVGFGAVENTLGTVDFVLLTTGVVAVVLSTEDGVVTAVVADVMNSGSSSKKG